MKVSLDTNAYTRLVLGHRPLADLLECVDEIFLSTVVLGELIAGFTMENRRGVNMSVLQSFLDTEVTAISDITKDVAERYAIIFTGLRSQGTPIPTNDIWIAAAALETGSRLITYDTHFNKIPGIVVLSP
jgi:tRNA(fMet)-specific endonuclease VapC